MSDRTTPGVPATAAPVGMPDEDSLTAARRYVRAWIDDATTIDEIVEKVAPRVVVLWGICERAEEAMCWWAEQVEQS